MTATTARQWIVVRDDDHDADYSYDNATMTAGPFDSYAEADEFIGWDDRFIVITRDVQPLATLGDWQGCEPSMLMTGQSTDWRSQWLSRRGHRERWAFWGRVARKAIAHNPAAERSALVYEAAAAYAPASVWVVIAGQHEAWDEPEHDEEWVAGPFATEDEAIEHCDEELVEFSAVPRHPSLAPLP